MPDARIFKGSHKAPVFLETDDSVLRSGRVELFQQPLPNLGKEVPEGVS